MNFRLDKNFDAQRLFKLGLKFGTYLIAAGALSFISGIIVNSGPAKIILFSLSGFFVCSLIALWLLALAFSWNWLTGQNGQGFKNCLRFLIFFSIAVGSWLAFSHPVSGLKLMAPGLSCLALWGLLKAEPSRLSRAVPGISNEKIFLCLLGMLVLGLYTIHLNDVPQGAHGHEGIMVPVVLGLGQQGYLAHCQNDSINWPTLIFYQALACSKVFGISPASLRLPSALWGLLTVFAFYFVCRRLSSPWVAGVATLLFAVDSTMLTWSRVLFPGTVLMFAELAAIYFLLASREKGSKAYLLCAGAAVGLALHGYIPGRMLAPSVMGWMLCLQLLPGEKRFSAKDWLAFGSAFLATLFPILLWYIRTKGQFYWNYIETVNPSHGTGAWGYLQTFFSVLPDYLKMFNVSGDPGGIVPRAPWLPPLVGGLFLLGFAMCLFRLRAKQHLLLVMVFFAVLLPAILGGGFGHPTSRRAIMALPLCYLFFGMGLDKGWTLLAGTGSFPRLRKGMAALGILLLAAQTLYSLNLYFFIFPRQTVILKVLDHTGFLVRQELEQLPQPRIAYIPADFAVDATAMTFAGERIATAAEPEDIFRKEGPPNQLFALDGIYGPAMDFIQAALPGSLLRRQADIYEGGIENAPLGDYDAHSLYWSVRLNNDGMKPIGQLRMLRPGSPARDVAYGEKQGWNEGQPGSFSLEGTLVVPDWGSPAKLTVAGKGELYVNGALIAPGKEFWLAGGINDLAYRGQAAGKGALAFPFSIALGRAGAKCCFLPLRWPHGVHMEISDPTASPPQVSAFRRPYAAYHFGLGNWKNSWQITVKTAVEIPADGDYEFGAGEKCGLLIWADNQEVFDNWLDDVKLCKPLHLKAGQRLSLRMRYNGLKDMEPSRAFQLLWKKPGSANFTPVPGTALWL